MSYLFTIGVFLSFFLSILLFSKSHKRLSDNILGVWLVCIGIYLLNYYLHYLGYWEKYPHLVGITHPFPLLFATFVYLYVVVNLRQPQRLYWQDGLHLLLFILSYLIMFPFLFGYSAAEKALIDREDYHSPYQWFFVLSFVTFVVVSVLYWILAYRKINQYERMISEQFAYNEGISLQWLKFILIGFGVIFGVMIGVYIVQYLLEIAIGFNIEIILFGLFILLIGLIGFLGIQYQGIFTTSPLPYNTTNPYESKIIQPLTESKTATPPTRDEVQSEDEFLAHTSEATKPISKSPEYRKSGLKTEDAHTLHEQLLLLMQIEKPYIEPKLSLAQLAERLRISPNHLSQIINQYEEKNFYDFVNGYRVKEFITLAEKDTNKNFNLLGLAYEAGFNSKSSFNQVFKKFTSKTPSQFVNELMSQCTH